MTRSALYLNVKTYRILLTCLVAVAGLYIYAHNPFRRVSTFPQAIKLNGPRESQTCVLFNGTLNKTIEPDDTLTFSFAGSGPVSVLVKAEGNPTTAFQSAAQKNWSNVTISLKEFTGKFSSISFNRPDSVLIGGVRLGNFVRKSNEKNVIIISLDTLRADRLGINGYFRNTSPWIDKIARNGTNFAQAISPSPWTRPSHMSLFTGLYPSHHGLTDRFRTLDVELSHSIPTLTEVLQKAGYKTQAITGSAMMAANFGFYRGFDQYRESIKGVPSNDADYVFSSGIKWIEKNASTKFFLFLHTFEIHSPFTHDSFLSELKNPTSDEVLNAKYDSGIRAADTHIGTLMKTLDTLGLTRATIVVVLSDHGEDLNTRYPNTDHGHTLYDELIRVPLIFSCPGTIVSQTIKTFQAQLTDIFPTILEALDISDTKLKGDGTSLWPILKGKAPPETSIALSEALNYGPDRISLRKISRRGRYKFVYAPTLESDASYDHFNAPFSRDVRNFNGREFYDLNSDPLEKRNVFSVFHPEKETLHEMATEHAKSRPHQGAKEPAQLAPDDILRENLRSLGY